MVVQCNIQEFSCGNELNNLARLSIHELIKKYDGIGVAKAAAIVVG